MTDYSVHVHCPLLSASISPYKCQAINFAVEGRTPRDSVSTEIDLEQAEILCSDCVNAYWNRRMEKHGPYRSE
jgi:hypothetical protein